MSGGATTLCLDPSVRHLAPLMVECPTGQVTPRSLLTASVPRTLGREKVD